MTEGPSSDHNFGINSNLNLNDTSLSADFNFDDGPESEKSVSGSTPKMKPARCDATIEECDDFVRDNEYLKTGYRVGY